MKDDEYIFLSLTILGIPCRYNVLLSGHIQLGEYSVAVREQASRAEFSTKHIVSDSREPEHEKGRPKAVHNQIINNVFTSISLKVMFF